MIYLQMFVEFFKVGLFSIGGGLATIPFLYEMSIKTGWFTAQQLTDMIAVSESTPGPLGVNMATYVGYTVAGIPGCLIATLGLILPSFIIILIVVRLMNKYRESSLINNAFYSLRPASVALISAAGIALFKTALLYVDAWKESGRLLDLFNIKGFVFAVIIFILLRKFKGHPVIYILGSGMIGVLINFT